MKLTPEKIDLLVNGSRDERTYACARSFKLFAIYYFTKYFHYRPAPFHEEFYQDFEDLVTGKVKDIAWIAYRESAKTSIAKIGLCWIIARKQVIEALRDNGEDVSHWGERLYINVDAYDKDNAEKMLFDVVTELQTNELIIEDFGHLYNQPRSSEQKTVKRVADFVTTNGIRVEAHSALTSTRGRLYGDRRPDFILRDDIENEITILSPVTTEKVISVLDSSRAGKSGFGAELTLGNYLIEEGTIAYIRRSVIESGGRVRFIPVKDKHGVISWPQKYVHTDIEAMEANRDQNDPSRRKISLQAKQRELNSGGRRVFEVEMMLDPVAAGSPFFDRPAMDRLLTQATPPKEEKANLYIWEDFKPSHAYGIGADTGKGNGGDHSTSVIIDFSTIPARVVATYANNMIAADQFAHELKRQGNMYGTCLVAPEKNSESGGSCLTTLKMIYPVDWIYRQIPFDRLMDKEASRNAELGWETNGATKYMMLNDVKTALEDGQLACADERVLKEARSFTYTDADDNRRSNHGHFTRHFDLLMAVSIAWAMRKYARVHEPETKSGAYEQQPYERPGYE